MSIGTMRESALHEELKHLFTGYSGSTEIRIGRFVCDGSKDDGTLVEIQLGSFAPLMRKVEWLRGTRRIVILHPVILKKEIFTFDTKNRLLSWQISPRKGSDWDLFRVLVRAPELPLHDNVCIELAYIDVSEIRVDDGAGSWRRKGVSIRGRALKACHGSVLFSNLADYRRFAPFAAGEQWTVRQLALAARIRLSLAQKTVYVLSRVNLIKKTGKKGNANVWQLA